MKWKVFMMMVLSLFVFAACSSDEETNMETEAQESESAEEAENEEAEAEESDGVEVDKGLLNVEVTLPAIFFEDENIDEVIEEAKEDGVKEVTENSDGSVTYKMSKKDHKKMMESMGVELEDSVNEIKNNDDFTSIQDITYNSSFTEFTIVVDREQFENSFDGFVTFSLGLSGMMYQLFDGVDMEKSEVIINVEDEATGEVFNEVVYPEALEEMENLKE